MTTILFVEDEAPIRDLVRFALSRAGMAMLEAEDAERALALLHSRRPDLVLIDWMLPGASGLQLLRRIRRTEPLQDLPVILLTAMAEEEHKIQGLDAGADDYVTKPFSPAELVARIRALLRRAQGLDQAGRLRRGALEIDSAAHQVTYAGEAVSLSPTEYRLLRFLMAHPGRVYSRAQLLDAAWPDDDAREERTVDASVRRLRRALEPFGAQGVIETVRGAGYRLAVDD